MKKKEETRPKFTSTCVLLWLSHSVMSNSSATPWTVAHQAPMTTAFSRQEYWSGLPCPPPGTLQGWNPSLLLGRQILYH